MYSCTTAYYYTILRFTFPTLASARPVRFCLLLLYFIRLLVCTVVFVNTFFTLLTLSLSLVRKSVFTFRDRRNN